MSLIMNFDDYQKAAVKTAIYPGSKTIIGLSYTTLGLAGEAGEVAGKVKKILRDKQGLLDAESKQALGAELADVLWYIAATCEELGLSMSDIAQQNVEKLASRAARGVLGGSGDNR